MNNAGINRLLQEGFNCAQIVLSSVSEEYGLDETQAKKISGCFGGGMGCGETCGAVTGALMALGLKYGNCLPNDRKCAAKAMEKAKQFRELFLQEYDSTMCREILGYDLSNPEEMEIIKQKELFFEFCPGVIEYAIEVLKEVL